MKYDLERVLYIVCKSFAQKDLKLVKNIKKVAEAYLVNKGDFIVFAEEVQYVTNLVQFFRSLDFVENVSTPFFEREPGNIDDLVEYHTQELLSPIVVNLETKFTEKVYGNRQQEIIDFLNIQELREKLPDQKWY